MHIFYCPDIKAGLATLSPDESGHCIRVLRLRQGDKVRLVDGFGGMYEAVIAHPDSQKCQLRIVATVYERKEKNYSLHIGIAPTKNIDRFEWFVEKAVEIGIDKITPLLCQRSERKDLRIERLQKLAVSTMKQAMVPTLPVIQHMMPFGRFCQSVSGNAYNRFIAYCGDESKKGFSKALVTQTPVLVLVGPEGDFSQGEIDLAIQHDFVPVSLGLNRLRTETAGVVVCQTVNLLNELI
jgi:16S rRNA (uracil1498-N3)-methyltransferase